MGTTIDQASFSLWCLVFVIAAGFLSVIFLKVKFSPPSRVSDMKLVRTNLDISLCSCIIQFPDSIRKVVEEERLCSGSAVKQLPTEFAKRLDVACEKKKRLS